MAKKNKTQVETKRTLGSLCKQQKITLELCGGFFKEDLNFNPEQEIALEDKHLVKNFMAWCEHFFNTWTDADMMFDQASDMQQIVAEDFNEAIQKQKYILDPKMFEDGYNRLCKVFEGQFELTPTVKKVMLLAVMEDLKKSNKQRLFKHFDVK